MEAGDLSTDQHAELDRGEHTGAGRGMMMVGVPIGTDENCKEFATEVAMGEAAALLIMLVKIEDVQASFNIMHLSASSRLTFLLHTPSPTIKYLPPALVEISTPS